MKKVIEMLKISILLFLGGINAEFSKSLEKLNGFATFSRYIGMSTLEELKQIAKDLGEKINLLHREVTATADEPRLAVKGGYLYKSVTKGCYKYLSKTDLPLAKHLAQERYCRELLKALEKEKANIEKCIRTIEKDGTADNVYNNLPEPMRKLFNPSALTAEGYAIKWQEKKFNCKQPPENSPYYTAKGEHVRSKSEVIIADRLNANGIPYHYEAATPISGFGLQYPDFMVLNKRTGKVMLWEHFGMMEDIKYCRETIQKLENYQMEGCVLGRDLIVSFESTGKPIATRLIDKLIEDYLK